MRSALIPIFTILLVVACAKPPRSAQSAGHKLSDAEMQRIVQMTAWARQLKVKRPVRIERLSPDRFVKALLHRTSSDASEEEAVDAAHALLGFNLVPPPEAQDQIAKTDDLLAEQVVGFYDREVDRVFVPDVGMKSFSEEIKTRGILAHEIHHALQAQHFDVKGLSKVEGEDVALARLALLEGDAMVTMAAYFGADYGKPIHRTIRAISDITQKVSLDDVADRDSELGKALPLTREMLIFPYDQGMSFVSDIFRAGGFELVNRLYHTPPQSTAQVIHPEKYIAGELPASIQLPPILAPFEVISEGRLGELRTRVTLAQCNDAEKAWHAASGWRGDAYQVARRPDGATAVAWLTVLDSEPDAKELAAALSENQACWRANRVGRLFVDAGAYVASEGDRVAMVRGLKRGAAEAHAARMLKAQVTLPASTAVGDFSIPPRRPLPKYRPGMVQGDRYVSAWLGIEGRLPAGMRYSVGKSERDIELEVKRDRRSYAALFVSDRITDERYIERVFGDILRAIHEVIDPSRLTVPITTAGRGPLGKGIVRSWTVIGTGVDMRAILIPICNGTGSLIFLQMFSDDYSRKVMDGWVSSFRWIEPGATIPACERLDPR